MALLPLHPTHNKFIYLTERNTPMGLFSRNKKQQTAQDPHQIQLDFFEDWFHIKYQDLFSSKYLAGLKYVKDLNIDREQIDIFQNPNYKPSDIDEAITITNLHIDTIISMETAFIILGHQVMKNPTYLLDKDFEQFYHKTLPHFIEALRLLDEYGQQNGYPYMRVNATLRRLKYTPNFTIEAGDIASQPKLNMLDLSFYDRFDKLRNDIYDAAFKLVQKFYDNEHDMNFNKKLAVIDDLLQVAESDELERTQSND